MSLMFGHSFQYSAMHYDVDFKPDKPPALFRSIMEIVRQTYFKDRFPAFDGRKNLFSSTPLPFDDEVWWTTFFPPIPHFTNLFLFQLSVTVQVPNENGRMKEFKVKLKLVNEIDMSWLKKMSNGGTSHENREITMQILDVVLRAASNNDSVVPVCIL